MRSRGSETGGFGSGLWLFNCTCQLHRETLVHENIFISGAFVKTTSERQKVVEGYPVSMEYALSAAVMNRNLAHGIGCQNPVSTKLTMSSKGLAAEKAIQNHRTSAAPRNHVSPSLYPRCQYVKRERAGNFPRKINQQPSDEKERKSLSSQPPTRYFHSILLFNGF